MKDRPNGFTFRGCVLIGMAVGAFLFGQVIAPRSAGTPDDLALLADTLRIGVVVGLVVPGVVFLVLGLTGNPRR